MIGDAAKNQAPNNPANTIFDIKRLIGRKFDDSTVQSDAKLFPFKCNILDCFVPFFILANICLVIEGSSDSSGKPVVNVEVNNELKTFNPEEVSAMVSDRRNFLGLRIKSFICINIVIYLFRFCAK